MLGYLDVLTLHDLEHFNVYVFCTLIQHYKEKTMRELLYNKILSL